jgi:hypothetical protein
LDGYYFPFNFYSFFLIDIAPIFTMSKERSCTGPICVSVTFPDGYKDDLVLSKFHANEKDRIANIDHCNYIGHLANEPEACVAMTGCIGSEDIHLTILSSHATESSMFKWTKDGNIEIIESGFKVHTFHFLILYENASDINIQKTHRMV